MSQRKIVINTFEKNALQSVLEMIVNEFVTDSILFGSEYNGDFVEYNHLQGSERVFYTEVAKHAELHPQLLSYVKRIADTNRRVKLLWSNDEIPSGSHAIVSLALADKKYIYDYIDFLHTNDLDHEVYQGDDIHDIVHHWGWCKETVALSAMRSIKGQFGSDQFHEMMHEGLRGYLKKKDMFDYFLVCLGEEIKNHSSYDEDEIMEVLENLTLSISEDQLTQLLEKKDPDAAIAGSNLNDKEFYEMFREACKKETPNVIISLLGRVVQVSGKGRKDKFLNELYNAFNRFVKSGKLSEAKLLLQNYLSDMPFISRQDITIKTDAKGTMGNLKELFASDALVLSVLMKDDEVLEMAESLLPENINDAMLAFNLACLYAIKKNKEKMILFIGTSLKLGKTREAFIADSDFDFYKTDVDFLMTIGE